MDTMDCCDSCVSPKVDALFPMDGYVPYRPGYGHTFSVGAYERGDGNPRPEYPIRGLRPVAGYDSGVQSMGVFPLVGWGVLAGLGALGILGATYVANTAAENITTPWEGSTPITTTITETSRNFTNLALILGITAIVFRKEIKKALK